MLYKFKNTVLTQILNYFLFKVLFLLIIRAVGFGSV